MLNRLRRMLSGRAPDDLQDEETPPSDSEILVNA
jgi:hypothetical protein